MSLRVVRFAGLLIVALTMNGCGGGGNNSGGSGGSTSSSVPLQGVYAGATTDGSTFESIILPNSQYYALYGKATDNTFVIDGMMIGSTESDNGSFSASITDYYHSGALYTGAVTGTYVPGVSVNGTVKETGNTPVSFTGTTAATSPFNFNTPSSLSSVTGEWSGMFEGGISMTMTVRSNGSFSGIDEQGCSFSGTFTPDPSSKNFFDMSLTPGTGCSESGLTTSGIAVSYPLTSGVNQLLAGGVATTNSAVAFEFSATAVLPSTTTSLTASPNPATVGSSVTFTAAVTSSGSAVPTGTVTFKDGSTVLGSGALNSSGVAVFTTSSLAIGQHSITAVYGGDTKNSASTSAPRTEYIESTASDSPIFVQSTNMVTSAPPAVSKYSATFSNPVTSGDLIAVAFWWNYQIGASVVSVTDSAGNVYAPVLQAVESVNNSAWIYAAKNVTGGNNLTVTVTVSYANSDQFSMAALEYSGVTTSDVTSTNSGIVTSGLQSGTVVSSGSGTTTQPNELILGVGLANVSLASGSGFNSRLASGNFYVEDKFVSSIGSYDTEFVTTSTTQYEGWSAGMATFY